MNFKITTNPKVLHVLATGDFSLDEAKQNFVDIASSIEETERKKVLIDGRKVTGNPTTVERFYYSEFAANTVRERLKGRYDSGPQFAYVLHEPVLDPHRFGETVAVNRGMNMKVFANLDQALGWLGLALEDI